jgi:hypothetical protein
MLPNSQIHVAKLHVTKATLPSPLHHAVWSARMSFKLVTS